MWKSELWAASGMVFLLALVGCVTTSKYVWSVPPGQGARIRVSSVVAPNRIGQDSKVLLDIYNYDDGCPDGCVRLRSKGYQGSVTMLDEAGGMAVRLPVAMAGTKSGTSKSGAYVRFVPTETNDAVVVPAGKRIVLKGVFRSAALGNTVSCGAVLSFVPEEGHDYLYAFVTPDAYRRACWARMKEKSTRDGQTVLAPIPSLLVTVLRPGPAGCNSAEVCAWKDAPVAPPRRIPSVELAEPPRPLSPPPKNSEMVRPRLIHSTSPVYSREAFRADTSGTALVRCVLTVQGTLQECRIIRGLPFMDEALLAALPHWRFTPALFNGQPVELTMVLPIKLAGRTTAEGEPLPEVPLGDDQIFDLR